MNAPRAKSQSFFWQGLLILLPVVVLVFSGLASLRRDEQTAEQVERKRAAQNIEILARAVRSSVNDDLERFLLVQNEWITGLHSASQPTVKMQFPYDALQANLAAWERSYPALNVTTLAAPQGSILTDGRIVGPLEYSDAPVPPKWYLELDAQQRLLWQALRNAASDHASPESLRAARQAFVDTGVPGEAREAADCVLRPPEEMAGTDNALPATESGLPFQDLACFQILRTNRPPAPNWVMHCVWKRVIDHPSFDAPTLLEMAQTLTNGADAVVCSKVQRMGEYWRAQGRARDWIAPLSHDPGLATNWDFKTPWSRWTSGESDDALAWLVSCTFSNAAHEDKGYLVWFVPRPVIEAMFVKALADNAALIPEYSSAAVKVQGAVFAGVGQSSAAPGVSPMAGTTLAFGKHVVLDGANFELALYLVNRQKMLSAARARAVLFGLLIATAASCALVGFFAARRAFFRQLRLNEMKSDFVSSVSHELRAPIASVRLMAEGLERGRIQEPAKQAEYFRFIGQECRRLSSLIENVLDFSRIEQGRKQYEMESTDLVALTQQTVKLMETYAAERQIAIKLETSGAPVPIEADGKAIQQALINLIDNALKHSAKGAAISVGLEFAAQNQPCSHPPSPDFGAASERGHVKIWVEDHGEGIPASEHEKIFERFYRVGSELRRETQGVGIGLSIVKHIVEAHGGRVIVRSAPGQGSRFTIDLPAAQSVI